LAGETEVLGENLPQRHFVHLEPGPPSCKPTTNRLSYGAAYLRVWSLVPRDTDPKMTALARTTSSSKRQKRPLFRESALHQETSN
jgi:hypothetical protein